MANLVALSVDEPQNVLDTFGAGALMRVERDTVSTFATASEITTIAVVAATTEYEYRDQTGTSSHWYRSRFSIASPTLATDYSDYGAGFQAGAPVAYATLAEVKASMQLPDTTRDAYLLDLLVQGKEYIDSKCGRSFMRNPLVTGTTTLTFNVIRDGQTSLSMAIGYGVDIVSITTLTLYDSTGGTGTAIAAGTTGYYLVPGDGLGTPGTDWPYGDLVLSDRATSYSTFRRGYATVSIVGVFGFPAIPAGITQANVDYVREMYRQGPGGGAAVGTGAYGQPLFAAGMPASVYSLSKPGSVYVLRSFASI